MSFKKDNQCKMCSLYYPFHVFDFNKNICLHCAGNGPSRPVCFICDNIFTKEDPAIRVKIGFGSFEAKEKIVHRSCVKK